MLSNFLEAELGYKVPPTTLGEILAADDNIEFRMRKVQHPELEDCLYMRIIERLEHNIIINKAQHFGTLYNIQIFLSPTCG